MCSPSGAALTAALALALTGCPRATPPVPADLAARGVVRIPVDTGDAHGLSGLALADDGALWTIAERSHAAFRIELDTSVTPPVVRAIRRVDVTGLPRGAELESIAALPGGAFLVGTEGGRGLHAFRLEPDGDRLAVRGPSIDLTSRDVGVKAGGNRGLEGACAVPGLALLAVEATGDDRAGRWAPLIVVSDGGATIVRRLRLTTGTGKLSSLDCWPTEAGVRAVAIERHFEVTRVLAFDLDVAGTGDVTPTLVRDLAPDLHGALNLEGIVRLPDGHLITVVDNQYGGLRGPDELVWLAAPRLLTR